MVAKAAGGFLGGILNNPGAVILGGIAIALLFFSGDIRKAFGSLGENFGKIELPAITLPTINLPEINFPEINFPDFPDFSFLGDIFGNIGGSTNDPFNPPDEPTPVDDPILDSDLGPITPGTNCVLMPDGTVSCDTGPQFDVCVAFPQLCAPGAGGPPPDIPPEIFDPGGLIGGGPPPIIIPDDISAQIEGPESEFGGGPSFIGGITTFGSDIVDTLSEVLNIFPGLSASQAADALASNPGLLPGEFAQIDPDIINITGQL